MTDRISPPWLGSATLLAGSLLLAACSETPPDVRLTLCQDLSADMHGSAAGINWRSSEMVMQGYNDLEVRLQADDPAVQAVCFYEHEQRDEDARSLSDPASGYAAYPHKFTFNNQLIMGNLLGEKINAVMVRRGKAVVKQVKEGVRDAARSAAEGVEEAARYAKDRLQQE